LRIYVNNA